MKENFRENQKAKLWTKKTERQKGKDKGKAERHAHSRDGSRGWHWKRNRGLIVEITGTGPCVYRGRRWGAPGTGR